MLVKIEDIQVNLRHRDAQPEHVREIADSIAGIGLLNPITVDQNHVLIAGLHRLEAAKVLGWEEIECTICDLKGLQAELAEIDENYVRYDLRPTDRGELLLRRKEIYETLHPETKATYHGGSYKGNQYQKVVTDNLSLTSKSFAQDTAEKLNVSPRTVERQIQVAKNLTPETKQIIRAGEKEVSQENALKLARLAPQHQEEAAKLLTDGKIRSVDEYCHKEKHDSGQILATRHIDNRQ